MMRRWIAVLSFHALTGRDKLAHDLTHDPHERAAWAVLSS